MKTETMKNKMEQRAIAAEVCLLQKEEDFREYLKNNKGAAFMDVFIKIIIVLVLGGLLLGALYWIFKDTLIPEIQNRIMQMFNPPARP